MDQCCGTCRFWDTDYYWNRWTYAEVPVKKTVGIGPWKRVVEVMQEQEVSILDPNPDYFQGKCRRHAPSPEVQRAGTMSDGFPLTSRTGWCGEWEERPSLTPIQDNIEANGGKYVGAEVIRVPKAREEV